MNYIDQLVQRLLESVGEWTAAIETAMPYVNRIVFHRGSDSVAGEVTGVYGRVIAKEIVRRFNGEPGQIKLPKAKVNPEMASVEFADAKMYTTWGDPALRMEIAQHVASLFDTDEGIAAQ